ncbi:MAG: thioredoxin family protein [Spirochaetaceae bacterium]|nr:thioredoxin family protein [Spirochaetaceae bacterium]
MIRRVIISFFILISFSQVHGQFLNNQEIPEVDVIIEVIPNELMSGDSFTIYASYTIPEHYHMFHNEELFNIFIDNNAGFVVSETDFPMEESEPLLGLPSFSGTVTISKMILIPENYKSGDFSLEIRAAYQICEDDGTCLLPDSFIDTRNITIINNQDTSKSSSLIWTIMWYILLAFAGGLILNVMPCVLPLLSVKALNLVEQSHHDRKTILVSSLLYGLGILISFLSLALAVIILKSSGELFGWGFQFQNPLFVLFLLTIIFVFSLSLFDVFTLNAPRKSMTKASEYSVGRSYSGSLLTGIFAVLIATPCTAPFMGAALGFAFSQTPLVILLIFSSLSFGFALPFILLGLNPKLIKKIPKPGNWMNTFKEIMGFLLLGTVVYLLTTLHSLIGASIKGVLWFLLFTGLSIWIFGKFGSVIEKKSKRIIAAIVAIALIVFSAMTFVNLESKSEKSSIEGGSWQVFSSELVQNYRLENKAVFIDFYADWCTSCKVNDATVLNTKKISNLFKEYDVQLLKGDFTAGDREIAQWLSDFGRAGVPLYILFRPGEEAVVFPEFLTQSQLEEEIKKIRLE